MSYFCLQAELQSAADLGTTNRAPSSVWALHSALYAGQQSKEPNPQPFCAESRKPGAVLFDSPYLSELDSSADTGYFQGPTTSDCGFAVRTGRSLPEAVPRLELLG
ncbi:TPA: hypothetical protein ACH3X1_014311 [Trebouxia sp. C0004]